VKIFQIVWKSVKLCENLSIYVKICQIVWKSVKLYENLSNYVKICQIMWKYVKLCENLSNYVKICQIMWKSVKLCENMSNCVKICPVGSRVSPRGHTDGQTHRRTWRSWQSLFAISRTCLKGNTRSEIEFEGRKRERVKWERNK
jgi:ferredoxin